MQRTSTTGIGRRRMPTPGLKPRSRWKWSNLSFKHDCLAQELFENHVIEVPSVGNVILEEVEKIEGEARANNRKGKLIFFYEWEIAVKWKGHANGKDTEVFHHHHAHGKQYFASNLFAIFISGDWKD